MSPGWSGGEVTRFRGLLARRFGLAFDNGKWPFLQGVLERRLQATGREVQAYLRGLESGAEAGELAALAPEVTVGETYFFRHGDQLRAFIERALPERRRRRGPGEQVRVLSAGCASGEEPYSLAMVLREATRDDDLEIVGVDINRRALARSAAGVYGAWSLRDTPPPLRRRWFRPQGEAFVLDDGIRRAVRLGPGNLVADGEALWAPDRYDVVFCRNVLMYFEPAAARAALARLARALAPGGFLFLGHAENLRGQSADFNLCQTHGTFYYQRRGRLAATLPDAVATVAGWDAQRWIESIQQASARIARLRAGVGGGGGTAAAAGRDDPGAASAGDPGAGGGAWRP